MHCKNLAGVRDDGDSRVQGWAEGELDALNEEEP